MSAGLEPLLAAAWLYQRLSTDTALATGLGLSGLGQLAGRIWQGDAPDDVPTPLVVFNAQSLGNDVQGLGATIIMTDPLYTVRVVWQTADAGELASAAAAIHARLHQQADTVSLAAGATTISGRVVAARERPFYDEYNDAAGRPYRALGGIYRLYVDG